MTECICTFKPGTREYATLITAAHRMTTRSPKGYNYYVGDTYFDFGRGWVWTTILCDSGSECGDYQALTPVQQEDILKHDFNTAIDNFFNNEYCNDRI